MKPKAFPVPVVVGVDGFGPAENAEVKLNVVWIGAPPRTMLRISMVSERECVIPFHLDDIRADGSFVKRSRLGCRIA